MQGVFIDGERPRSKKAVKQIVKESPERVSLEATSMHGGEFNGPIMEMPANQDAYFVGPDPHTKRNFYGSIRRRQDGTFVVS